MLACQWSAVQAVLALCSAACREVEKATAAERSSGASGRRGLHLVVMGHVDAGKSTLMGRLLHDLGQVSQKEVHKNQRESAQAGKVRQAGRAVAAGLALFCQEFVPTLPFHVIACRGKCLPGLVQCRVPQLAGQTANVSACVCI